MPERTVELGVRGPWSLATSRRFLEDFAASPVRPGSDDLRLVFCADADWQRVEALVGQDGTTARITVRGPGDLDAAARQAARALSLDVDATDWPAVGERDEVVGRAQQALPGLRPCGFHSPYEAAVWAVLTQRQQRSTAAGQLHELTSRHGADGAFPAPAVLRSLDLDLPMRKPEFLHAVAEAALDGRLDGEHLRSLDAAEAVATVRGIAGLGPFSAELVVVRGANAPDVAPVHEPRLQRRVRQFYGADATVAEISETWRPFRTWAAVHLRAVPEQG